mmetsp:Transcript_80808/g.145831  ORF Transcript_80808/g.145831 Transcript_80808/m.145831 type:complete len:257 (-) Transcript_80808:32-802(-)
MLVPPQHHSRSATSQGSAQMQCLQLFIYCQLDGKLFQSYRTQDVAGQHQAAQLRQVVNDSTDRRSRGVADLIVAEIQPGVATAFELNHQAGRRSGAQAKAFQRQRFGLHPSHWRHCVWQRCSQGRGQRQRASGHRGRVGLGNRYWILRQDGVAEAAGPLHDGDLTGVVTASGVELQPCWVYVLEDHVEFPEISVIGRPLRASSRCLGRCICFGGDDCQCRGHRVGHGNVGRSHGAAEQSPSGSSTVGSNQISPLSS